MIAAAAGHANPHVHFIEQVVEAVIGQTTEEREATVNPDDPEIQH